jgi:hypothetical protein
MLALITHEIKRPRSEKPGVVQQIGQLIFGRREHQLQQQPPQYPVTVRAPIEPRTSHHWDKVKYAQWVEGEKNRLGGARSLVTLKGVPFVVNAVPQVIWEVAYVQEIHWHAAWDDKLKEPKAFALKLCNSKYSSPVEYAPSLLRPLTQEELDIVRVHDQTTTPAPKPEAVGSTVIDGQAAAVDAFGRVVEIDDHKA